VRRLRRTIIVGLAGATICLLGSRVHDAAGATYSTSCDPPPAHATSSTLTDEGIETRELRIETAHDCAATLERLELIESDLAQLADATTDPTQPAQRVALSAADRQLFAYGLGAVLCALTFGVAFWRTFGRTA
jgi:hypothetical protein